MTRQTRASRQEIDVPLPVTLAGGALVLWAIGHAILNRTAADFLRYPLYVAVPATALVDVFLVREWWKSRPRKVSGEELWIAAVVPVAFYAVAAAYYAVGVSIKDGYAWLQSLNLTDNGKIALAVGVTFVTGVVLFVFRLKLRSTYGLTEAMVGLVVAGSRVATDLDKLGTDPALYLTVLTAGVYLVVRGLDHVHQGLAKDPIARKLVEQLRGSPEPDAAPVSATPVVADPARRTVA